VRPSRPHAPQPPAPRPSRGARVGSCPGAAVAWWAPPVSPHPKNCPCSSPLPRRTFSLSPPRSLPLSPPPCPRRSEPPLPLDAVRPRRPHPHGEPPFLYSLAPLFPSPPRARPGVLTAQRDLELGPRARLAALCSARCPSLAPCTRLGHGAPLSPSLARPWRVVRGAGAARGQARSHGARGTARGQARSLGARGQAHDHGAARRSRGSAPQRGLLAVAPARLARGALGPGARLARPARRDSRHLAGVAHGQGAHGALPCACVVPCRACDDPVYPLDPPVYP
jgi:hypothetical protein